VFLERLDQIRNPPRLAILDKLFSQAFAGRDDLTPAADTFVRIVSEHLEIIPGRNAASRQTLNEGLGGIDLEDVVRDVGGGHTARGVPVKPIGHNAPLKMREHNNGVV